MRLKDRVAIVTGGGGGLGEGICMCLAREGAHVVVSDLKLELAEKVAAKVKELGQKAMAIRTDVRKPDECKEMVDATLKEMGRLDILVANAGVDGLPTDDSPASPLIEDIKEEDWDRVVDVNLKGVFMCNRAVAPLFQGEEERQDHQYLLRGRSPGRGVAGALCGDQGGRDLVNTIGGPPDGPLSRKRECRVSGDHLDAHVGASGQLRVERRAGGSGCPARGHLQPHGTDEDSLQEGPDTHGHRQYRGVPGLGRCERNHGPGVECVRRHAYELGSAPGREDLRCVAWACRAVSVPAPICLGSVSRSPVVARHKSPPEH